MLWRGAVRDRHFGRKLPSVGPQSRERAQRARRLVQHSRRIVAPARQQCFQRPVDGQTRLEAEHAFSHLIEQDDLAIRRRADHCIHRRGHHLRQINLADFQCCGSAKLLGHVAERARREIGVPAASHTA